MKPKSIGTQIVEATDGIIGTITDLTLTNIYFTLNCVGASNSYKIHRAAEDAERLIQTVNYQKIKHALYSLVKQGLVIRSKKRSTLEIEITQLGFQRIAELFPTYHTKRPWDGLLYLISYDIPTNANNSRNILRLYMKKIGCALLQESLWLTPYNPRTIIEQYIRDRAIRGTILVSKMGHDGSIGDENTPTLIRRIYRLDELKEKYDSFIETFAHMKQNSRFETYLSYHSILTSDPQLPFELEPNDLKANEAHILYQSLFQKRKPL